MRKSFLCFVFLGSNDVYRTRCTHSTASWQMACHMQSGPYTLELCHYLNDGRLLARPISVKDLPTRLDGQWTGDPYPSHDCTTVWPYLYYGTVRTPSTPPTIVSNHWAQLLTEPIAPNQRLGGWCHHPLCRLEIALELIPSFHSFWRSGECNRCGR